MVPVFMNRRFIFLYQLTMPNPVRHSLDVFAVQLIFHVYIKRSGYASEEAPLEEDIRPPSHNEKSPGAKQQLASLREYFEMILRWDGVAYLHKKSCRSTLNTTLWLAVLLV